MIKVNSREFTRRFAYYREQADAGESIRIATRNGAYRFVREANSITARELSNSLKSGDPIFDPGGDDLIEAARKDAPAAKSPWD